MLRQGVCGRVDKGHDRPKRGSWFVNFGETIEKGDLPCRTPQPLVETLRDGSRPHEGQEETIYLSLLGHDGVLFQPLVRLRVIKQGLYPSLIITAIHHHSDVPFVNWGDDNGIILP